MSIVECVALAVPSLVIAVLFVWVYTTRSPSVLYSTALASIGAVYAHLAAVVGCAHMNAVTSTVHRHQCVDGCPRRELLHVHCPVCPCVLCVRATAYCRRDGHGLVCTSGPVDVAVCRRGGQTTVAGVREHTCTVHTRLRVFACGENIY